MMDDKDVQAKSPVTTMSMMMTTMMTMTTMEITITTMVMTVTVTMKTMTMTAMMMTMIWTKKRMTPRDVRKAHDACSNVI